jgi:hypothetical protein
MLDRRPSVLFTGLLALAALVIACGSSTDAPPGMTGVWGGRFAYLTPNDSFAFSFQQNGSEVDGWGVLYSGSGPRAVARYSGTGIVAAGELTLALTDLAQTGSAPAFPYYYLSGPVERGQMNVTFEAGASSYPVALRPFRPAASDLAGTWVLTSATGAAAPAGLLDTIVASADGRAWRHREGDYSFGVVSMWTRRGSYLLIEHEFGELLTDSLLIQSSELQRSAVVSGGATRTEHYTRVSTSANLPRPW